MIRLTLLVEFFESTLTSKTATTKTQLLIAGIADR